MHLVPHFGPGYAAMCMVVMLTCGLSFEEIQGEVFGACYENPENLLVRSIVGAGKC